MSLSTIGNTDVPTKWVTPQSYDEMFRLYFPYMRDYVRRLGIDPQSAEDVAMSVFEKFLSNNVLEDFDADSEWEYKGKMHKAVFRTFLSSFVKLYVRHHRERQQLNARREGISLDAPVVLPDRSETRTLADVLSPVLEPVYEELEEQDLVSCIREHLATVPPTNNQDQCDLLLLFDIVRMQAYEHDKVLVAELAELFEVAKQTISNWMNRLRVEVSYVLESR